MNDITDEEIARFIEGEATETRAAEIGAYANTDGRLRARIASLRALKASLATDPDLDVLDVLPAVQLALQAPVQPRSRRLVFASAAPPAVLLAATLALLAVQQRDDDGFRAKGAAGRATSTGVTLFHGAGDALVPVERQVRAHDGIAVAYTNAAPEPFSHLMIFAVDDARRVFWYWPAYVETGADPSHVRAMEIHRGRDVELGDVVQHAFAPGAVTVYAVFLRGAVAVGDVERAVAGGRAAPFDLGVDADWQTMRLEVMP